MKLYGLAGKGTGKLGSQVFAISGGEQIVRQYNPVVSNPSTDAQVEQRAKFKLLSQLAAILAPAIAIRKSGLVSARNRFVQINYPSVIYQAEGQSGLNEAVIVTPEIKLTDSNVSIPGVFAQADASGGMTVQLSAAAPENIQGVTYVVLQSVGDAVGEVGELRLVAVQTVTTPGINRQFTATVASGVGSFVVLGYGFYSANGSDNLRYDNIGSAGGGVSALLLVQRLLRTGSALFTETSGFQVTIE